MRLRLWIDRRSSGLIYARGAGMWQSVKNLYTQREREQERGRDMYLQRHPVSAVSVDAVSVSVSVSLPVATWSQS